MVRSNLNIETKLKNKFSDNLVDLSLSKDSLDEKVKTDDSTKAAVISYAIDILISFSKIYQDIICFKEIFSVSRKLLNCVNTENNPDLLKVITIC